MEAEKKHISYTDTVKQMAATSWGRKYDSDEEAQRELLKTMTLEGACLLDIFRRIDRVISSLTSDENADRIKRIQEKVDASIKEFVDEREAKHGECPRCIRQYLRDEANRSIGSQVMYGDLPDGYLWFSPSPPPSKTKERREYDKWMRRKPKVES